MSRSLPRVEQWRRDFPDRARLVIVNGESFPKAEIMESLGLGKREHEAYAFGLADEEEIRARLDLQRMFHESPAFRQVVDGTLSEGGLPTGERQFLSYFDPGREHTPFWQGVHNFLAAVDAYPRVPRRVAIVAQALRDALPLEQQERAMAEQIGQEVLRAATLAGLVTFRIDAEESAIVGLKMVQAEVGGHRLFSRETAKVRLVPMPQWTEKYEYRDEFLGLVASAVRGVVHGINWVIKRGVFRDMVIGGSSSAIEDDLTRAVFRQLWKIRWAAWPHRLDGATVHVFFRYSKDGLEIRILDMEFIDDTCESGLSDDLVAFPGYTAQQHRAMRRVNAAYRNAARMNVRLLRKAQLHAFAEGASPGFFLSSFNAPSPAIDALYRWTAIRALYESKEHRAVSARAEELRTFFGRQLRELRAVLTLYRTIRDRAEALGLPFCIPEVAKGEHVVQFDHLFPAQLLLRMKPGEAVPVDGLPELDGRMIGLTGKHGGGKTETQLAVLTSIYLAQSGLPVFARQFRFNVKQVLGIVFISQRGIGSTAQQYLEKLRNVLEEIRGMDGKDVVLILDELGTGTQEDAGYDLGREILSRLAARGISILFSTQIIRLAEYSQRELDALCVQFNAQHRISAGIAGGGMDELRREMGIDRLLEELKV